MVAPTIHDYWLLPNHEEFVAEIRKGIESIRSIPRNNRQQRRQRTDQVRQETQAKIRDFSQHGDAQLVSNFYTVVLRLVEAEIEGEKVLQDIWLELMRNYRPNYPPSPVEEARLLPVKDVLESLPEGSWLVSMKVTLLTQFASKGESEFHYSNNPIVRDRLTGLPMVKPATWKGHLRFAARMAHGVADETQEPEPLRHLFGESRGEEGGMEGRLRFFPTFFTTDARREIVTPLKRSTRTPARGPLDIEVVPRGSKGTFCLLYLPHPKGPGWSLEQIAEDLEAVAPALKAMFLDYGFSAKKTAGWGVVEDSVSDGSLSARGPIWPATNQDTGEPGQGPFRAPEDAFLPLMDEAGMPRSILLKPDGTWLSNSEFNALAEKPSSLNVYRRFRSWYKKHGSGWRRSLAAPKDASAVPVRTYSVESVTALSDLAARLARAIRAEGANG